MLLGCKIFLKRKEIISKIGGAGGFRLIQTRFKQYSKGEALGALDSHVTYAYCNAYAIDTGYL